MHGHIVGEYTTMLKKQGFGQMQWRPEMRRRMFQLIDENVHMANDRLLAFAFVREPFDRVVSCYHNKMTQRWETPGHDLRWMRDDIIRE